MRFELAVNLSARKRKGSTVGCKEVYTNVTEQKASIGLIAFVLVRNILAIAHEVRLVQRTGSNIAHQVSERICSNIKLALPNIEITTAVHASMLIYAGQDHTIIAGFSILFQDDVDDA